MYIDKSKLMMYLECPRLFSDVYILEKKMKETPKMRSGSEFHTFAKDFWERKMWADNFKNINSFTTNINGDCLLSVENFIKLEKERYSVCDNKNRLDCFAPLVVEKKFINEENMLLGIVDRVDKNFDDTLNIVELKGYGFQLNERLKLELSFYKILLNFCGMENIKQGVVYFSKTGVIRKLRFSEDLENKVLTLIKELKEAIRKDSFVPKEDCNCLACRGELK